MKALEKNKSLRIVLAQPRGFCAGVERAIEIVERALKIYGPPVYVRHEIVHNKRVVNNLSSKGAIFVQERGPRLRSQPVSCDDRGLVLQSDLWVLRYCEIPALNCLMHITYFKLCVFTNRAHIIGLN